MPSLSLPRSTAPSRIAWSDIEALPIYAAIALGLGCLLLALLDHTPSIHAATLKVVGIFGSLALRHAWLKLDESAGTKQ